MEHDIGCDANCNWCVRINSQSLVRKLEDLKIGEQADTNRTTTLLREEHWNPGDWCGELATSNNNNNSIYTSECSKLAPKEYKARHDWVGKVILWEMCKKFKFDHTNKWYMHNQAPVLENDRH